MREVASVLEIFGDFVHPDPPTNAEDCCRPIPNGEPTMAHNTLAKPNQVGLTVLKGMDLTAAVYGSLVVPNTRFTVSGRW